MSGIAFFLDPPPGRRNLGPRSRFSSFYNRALSPPLPPPPPPPARSLPPTECDLEHAPVVLVEARVDPLPDVGRQFVPVAAVGLWQRHAPGRGPARGEDLLLDAADGEHAARQGDLTGEEESRFLRARARARKREREREREVKKEIG